MKNAAGSESLVKYVAFKSFKEPKKNYFTIQVCVECVEGNTLEMFVTAASSSSTSPASSCSANKAPQSYVVLDARLMSFAAQLLNVLDLLHRNQLSHGLLKLNTVYLCKDGATLRISDFGLIAKIEALYANLSSPRPSRQSGSLAANAGGLREAIKTDIYQLGHVLVSLRMGEWLKEFELPASGLGPELKNFLFLCQRRSDKVDSKYLLNHPFMLKDAVATTAPNYKRTISIHYDDGK